MRNHLLHNVELLAQMKPHDLARLREQLKGTKLKMAVYRCAGLDTADDRVALHAVKDVVHFFSMRAHAFSYAQLHWGSAALPKHFAWGFVHM